MVGTVDLCVAVHTASVEGKDIESGHGRVATDNVDVALLAQLVGTLGQQTGVVGSVRRMASEAILLHRGMIPQQWAALLRVTLITNAIGGAGLELLFAAFSSVRVMAGGAIHFHNSLLGAEKMGRALEESLADVSVAAEARILDGEPGQHPLGGLGVVGAVTRQAAHVVAVVRPAPPGIMTAIPGVALQARFVGFGRRQFGWVDDVLGFQAFNMFCAVAMAALAGGGARILQEFGAFAVNVQSE